MRLDLGAILIFSISGLVMAGLHANQHFVLPALAPLLYNLGQIFGVTVLSPAQGLRLGGLQLPGFGLGLYGLVYGVILGACLHLAIQVPALLRYQFHWRPVLEWKSAAIHRVLILLGPRVLTMGCIQAYFVARDSLASRFEAVGVGALNLGWTIEQVPETIIGSALAVAILPSLAQFIDQGQTADFIRTVNRALRIMLALSLPTIAVLGLTVRPLAQGFFGFDSGRLDLLTACTWAFLVGLVGDTWLEVAVRSYYANLNTRTPLIGAAMQVAAFIALAPILSNAIGLAGIPLAAALAYTVQAIILLSLLNRRFPGLIQVRGTLLRATLGAIAAGAVTEILLSRLPASALPAALVAMIAGGLTALPFALRELRLLMNL
jgi:putative peptidoglycan lipid II flippase